MIDCDVCGQSYRDDYTGFSIWLDDNSADEALEDTGWYIDEGKHYCKDCHEIDDNDNLIIKPKTEKMEIEREIDDFNKEWNRKECGEGCNCKGTCLSPNTPFNDICPYCSMPIPAHRHGCVAE